MIAIRHRPGFHCRVIVLCEGIGCHLGSTWFPLAYRKPRYAKRGDDGAS